MFGPGCATCAPEATYTTAVALADLQAPLRVESEPANPFDATRQHTFHAPEPVQRIRRQQARTRRLDLALIEFSEIEAKRTIDHGTPAPIAAQRLAISAPRARAWLDSNGISASETTIRDRLRRLYGRSGQLWISDPSAPPGVPTERPGCVTYNLLGLRTSRPYDGRCLIDRLARHLRRSRAHRRTHYVSLGSVSLRGGVERRVSGALRWALERARVGNRNGLGFRLVAICRQIGLGPPGTAAVLDAYRRSVPDPRSYARSETAATLRSAFRGHTALGSLSQR